MTLNIDPMTFNISSKSADTLPNHYQILEEKKTKNPRRNLPEAFFMRGIVRTHLGNLQPSPRPPGQI